MGMSSLRRLAGVTAALALAATIPAGPPATAAGAGGRQPVDLELVLAVDISYSMDTEEQALQRAGYAHAVTSQEFLHALRLGPIGRIAVTYVEWAGESEQQVVVDWQVVDGPQSAAAFAERITAAPLRRVYRTSISGALLYSVGLFDDNDYEGIRKVIDISGDGVNNQGPPVDVARDMVVRRGVTINGLPLLLRRVATSAIDVPELDIYYEDCVIGGPGAFVIPVEDEAQFTRAIKTKLVLELAGMAPPKASDGLVIRVAKREPRISCTIGEKIWQDHWSN